MKLINLMIFDEINLINFILGKVKLRISSNNN